MKDIDLLIKVAKIAGYKVTKERTYVLKDYTVWDPLGNPIHSFHLMVDMDIDVYPEWLDDCACANSSAGAVEIPHGANKKLAVMRAIVEAVALMEGE